MSTTRIYLSLRLLDTCVMPQYDAYKRVYADLLYRWGLLSHRALVLKYVSTPTEPHQGLGMFAIYIYMLSWLVTGQSLTLDTSFDLCTHLNDSSCI